MKRHDSHPIPDAIKQAYELRVKFGEALRHLEKNNTPEMAATLQGVLREISKLRVALAHDYGHVLSARLQGMTEDMAMLKNLGRIEKEDVGSIELLYVRIEAYIATIESEVKKNYPRKFSLPPWVITYKKRLAFGVFGIIALCSLTVIFIHHLPNKEGLRGDYYRGANFGKFIKTRVDKTINFNWDDKSPAFSVPRDNFSIRWTGYVLVPKPGNYEFYTRNDDGARLWIDDQQIIDDWNKHVAKTNRGVIQLTEGPHRIKLEYYEMKKWASIQLSWRQEFDPQVMIIPKENLVPSEEYLPH